MEGSARCIEPLWKSEIAGGFVQIRTWELAAIWTAYSGGALELLDVRVWLAAHEMAGRREAARSGKGRNPSFGMRELRGLVGRGVSEQRLRFSLLRLERLHLVRARSGGITFALSLEEVVLADLRPVFAMLALLPPKRCWFPLPRRMLRVLCGGVKRGVMATVFGQCAFCLYRNGGAWSEKGRVKASRLGEAFALSTKSVYRAREHLVEVGFLARVGGQPAWATRRYGEPLAVNTAWRRDVPSVRLSSDEECSTGKKSTLPYRDPSSTKKNRNQEPTPAAGPPGVCSKAGKENRAPTWRDIRREDLESTERRLALYVSAVFVGALLEGEASKLNFLAACERARQRGTANPCGLLRWLVERNEFRFVTNDEEEAARRALRAFEQRHLLGAGGEKEASASPRRALSPDARFVRELRRSIERRGVFEDPFPHVERVRPEWTRKRWERAVTELRSSRTAEEFEEGVEGTFAAVGMM